MKRLFFCPACGEYKQLQDDMFGNVLLSNGFLRSTRCVQVRKLTDTVSRHLSAELSALLASQDGSRLRRSNGEPAGKKVHERRTLSSGGDAWKGKNPSCKDKLTDAEIKDTYIRTLQKKWARLGCLVAGSIESKREPRAFAR